MTCFVPLIVTERANPRGAALGSFGTRMDSSQSRCARFCEIIASFMTSLICSLFVSPCNCSSRDFVTLMLDGLMSDMVLSCPIGQLLCTPNFYFKILLIGQSPDALTLANPQGYSLESQETVYQWTGRNGFLSRM